LAQIVAEVRDGSLWPPGSPETLIEMLQRWVVDRPDRRALTFVTDGTVEAEGFTFAELDARARSIAVHLRGLLQPGDRALLLYPPTLEFVAGFFGCLYAGVIAVPAYPPSARTADRLLAIMEDARPGAILAPSSIAPLVRAGVGADSTAPGLAVIETDTMEDRSAGWTDPGVGADTVAFLQYTSGSTATPKGVIVTHANLTENERVIQQGFGTDQDIVVVGWLPLYHDMGLIGNVLHPLYLGARSYVVSPIEFLKRPLSWLRAISHFRGTTAGGPNFGFERCVRKVSADERATLDLSSWQVAYNGAEPLSAETVERFAATFGDAGFSTTTMCPCYGLAEGTLYVSGRAPRTGADIRSFDVPALEQDGLAIPVERSEGRRLVSSGRTWLDQRVLIVDPAGLHPLPDGRVGEIWTSGPHVTAGYWNRPEESKATFGARLADGTGPFLRTGDLGFVVEGELYVTGRLKDLIIIRGRNYYPQDIERTIDHADPLVRPGCGAAFAVEVDGQEGLAVVQEVEPAGDSPDEADRVLAAIRRAVRANHDLRAHAVVLIPRGEIPKTSSGKLQRARTRELYLAGALPVLATSVLSARQG
jgi:acyl-CoA synthetase (AMP-forming)/AMP-acid ligase II